MSGSLVWGYDSMLHLLGIKPRPPAWQVLILSKLLMFLNTLDTPQAGFEPHIYLKYKYISCEKITFLCGDWSTLRCFLRGDWSTLWRMLNPRMVWWQKVKARQCYRPICPTVHTWQARILPLNHQCLLTTSVKLMTSSWQFNRFANNACFLTNRGSQIVSKLHF